MKQACCQKGNNKATVVITGVTHGLGRAMVDEFAKLGHIVAGCGRTDEVIQQLAAEYPTHYFKVVDVASDSQVNAWARDILARYGPPDFVLNNAAVLNAKASLWEVPSNEFHHILSINLIGVVNVIRYFAPAMISRGRGVIVNFVSRWGTAFEPQIGPYCSTKWALVALTKVLAAELRPAGVSAVGVNPGLVYTAMLRNYLGSLAVGVGREYPTPDEWAKIAVPRILRFSIADSGRLRLPPRTSASGRCGLNSK